MNFTNDVLLLLLTPIVVVFLVAIYALQSAASKILRIGPLHQQTKQIGILLTTLLIDFFILKNMYTY